MLSWRMEKAPGIRPGPGEYLIDSRTRAMYEENGLPYDQKLVHLELQ